MMYGIAERGRQRRFRGYEPTQHIVREIDIANNQNRVGLFIRARCGAVMVELSSEQLLMVNCRRCGSAKAAKK